jgi:WD40 repeat protein
METSIQVSVPANNTSFNIGFLNENEIVASTPSAGASIPVYSAITGAQMRTIASPCSGGYSEGIGVFPNGKSIVVNCGNSAFAVNIHTGKATPLAVPGLTIDAMAVSPDSKFIAIGGIQPGNKVLVFSAASGALLHTYSGSKSRVWSVAFSSDSQTVVAGSDNGLLNFWDLTTRKLLQSYNQETGDSPPYVSCIAYSADNQYVYYGRDDGTSVLIHNPVYFPIASVGLSPSSVLGGASATGTVTVRAAAPSFGAKVFSTSASSS